MNKTKKALLDDCREHLVFAIGSAAGAGEHETAARINAILIDIDISCEMCYTGKKCAESAENGGKEWKEADGETFESVVYDAAEKLGVEI